MNRVLIFLLSTLFLSTGAFFCSKRKPAAPAADSLKTVVSTETLRPYLNEAKPLPEADTIPQARHSLSFFLRYSDLWAIDTISRTQTQLTSTKGKLRKFYTSPTNKYVACERQIAITDEPGLFEPGKFPKRSIYSLMIVRAPDRKVIREFKVPPEFFGPFLMFDRWISTSRFLCTIGDGYGLEACFVYDAYRDSLQRVREDFGWRR